MKFNKINNKDWRTSLAGRSLTRSQKSVAPEQGLKSRKFGGSTFASGDKILVSKQTKKSLLQDLTNMLGLNFHFQS